MKINMTKINGQVRLLKEQSDLARSLKSSLLLYQRNLNIHWRGAEIVRTNKVLDDHVNAFTGVSTELDSICNDIIRAADAVRRSEELAD